ncbi:MAG: nucleotidyltransferase domain-containing protein [Halapricum sp.]
MEGDRDTELLTAFEESACADPAVEFVVAFGSQITGSPTRRSDLDLAVKFADDLSDRERFEKRCFLSGDLQRDDGPFVDVSDIEALPIEVAHDAVGGRFVCGDREAFERFKATVQTRFSDQRETLRRHQREVIDRIAEEGLRG